MILLAVYAVLVWYLALRFRRRWQGFVAVAVGVLAIWMVVGVIRAGDDRFGGPSSTHQILTLLWAEMFIVAAIGVYLACLPKPRGEMDCRGCGYNLSGLEPRDLSCPECGRRWTGLGSGLEHDRSARKLTPIPTERVRRRRGI